MISRTTYVIIDFYSLGMHSLALLTLIRIFLYRFSVVYALCSLCNIGSKLFPLGQLYMLVYINVCFCKWCLEGAIVCFNDGNL